MKRKRRGAASPMGLWMDAMQTGLATATTLAIRLPQLATGTMSATEAKRMIGEKMVAAAEGAFKGSAAMTRIVRRKPRVPTLFGLARDAMTVATASSGPARRKVKANSRRLSAKSERTWK